MKRRNYKSVRFVIAWSLFGVLLFFIVLCSLVSLTAQRSECVKLSKWLEVEFNYSTTAHGPRIRLSENMVVKVADEAYSNGFLPDYSSCRIVIKKQCHGLMDCASFKIQMLNAILHVGSLNRMSVILSDYDALVWKPTLKDKQIYSALPGHKTWSTSLMGFGRFAEIENGVNTANGVYSDTLRDDVAFRAVKSKTPNEDIQPTFHARGQAWPTKDPVLAFIIGFVIKIFIVYLGVTMMNEGKKVMRTVQLLILGFMTSSILHSIIKRFSEEYFVVPDDSGRVWFSFPFSSISIMIDNSLTILRSDLYGPFLTGSGAILAASISLLDEIGLTPIILYKLFSQIAWGHLLARYKIYHLTTVSPHLWNAISFFIFMGSFLISMAGFFGISVRGGIWYYNQHCSKVKCTTILDKTRFLWLAWDYVCIPLIKWSILVFLLSVNTMNKGVRRALIFGIVATIFLRCHYISRRAFPGSTLPTFSKVLNSTTRNGTGLSFDVEIPSRIEKVETTKFNVGSRYMVKFKSGVCQVHPNWHKVIWMHAVCTEKRKPRSILFYDDDVILIHLRDYMKLGLVPGMDATVVEDPHVPGRVVSYMGRFSLDNCSLISNWLMEMPCGTHKTLNDQPALNHILHEQSFSVKRVRIPVIHRDRGTKGFGFKPTLPRSTALAISLFMTVVMNRNRFCGKEELIFHAVMVYITGGHLKEIGLQRTSASPYEAVRELRDMKRVVEPLPRTYVIFEDYSGRAVELHFSVWVFLLSTLALFFSTNIARFLISMTTGLFIISGIDVAIKLHTETKYAFKRQLLRRWFAVYILAQTESGQYRIVPSTARNNPVLRWVKRDEGIYRSHRLINATNM